MLVFVSGSRSIKSLSDKVKGYLDEIIEKGYEVLVGDCYGVDTEVQRYFKSKGYEKVTVCFIGQARNCLFNNTIKVNGNRYEDKDERMASLCDEGLVIWDSVSRGSYKNIERLKKEGKKVKIIII